MLRRNICTIGRYRLHTHTFDLGDPVGTDREGREDMFRFATIALVGVSVLAAANSASAGETLSTRAIASLFPGQFHAVVKGYQVRFNAKRNGKLIGSYMASTDTGRWSISRGRLCIMMNDWTKGKTSCSQVVQAGDWYKAKDVKFRKL